MENPEVKTELSVLLKNESALLDKIICDQKTLHECVLKRQWLLLEESLSKLNEMSETFAQLDKKREELSAGFNKGDFELSSLKAEVKSKLLKSKLENRVLSEYIVTTRQFLQGVFDDVLPERRNVTYTRYGKLIKPELHNVVVDQII